MDSCSLSETMYFRDVLLNNKLLQHSKLRKQRRREKNKKKEGKLEILWILFLTGSTFH